MLASDAAIHCHAIPGNSSETARGTLTTRKSTKRATRLSVEPGISPSEVIKHLDRIAAEAVEVDGVMSVWPSLVSRAQCLRRASNGGNWSEVFRKHSISEIAWQDPFAAWSYARPRGYPGDARLIDFVYGHPAVASVVTAATPLGRDVYTFTYGAETSVAVRERRRLLARVIDATVERISAPEVLAVACGHLREIELLCRISEIGRFVALDQDGASLAELRSSYPNLGGILNIVESPVSRLVNHPTAYGRFDLIYASGLYDYLNDRTAKRVTNGLFQALKPGGRLLFANFASGIQAEGYMDAIMNWRLILRDEVGMEGLLGGLPREEVERVRVFRGNNGTVIYAVAVRK
jgi:SAM-dependent methyltransferase